MYLSRSSERVRAGRFCSTFNRSTIGRRSVRLSAARDLQINRTRFNRCLNGQRMAAVANLIEADANKQVSAPREEWDVGRIDLPRNFPRFDKSLLNLLKVQSAERGDDHGPQLKGPMPKARGPASAHSRQIWPCQIAYRAMGSLDVLSDTFGALRRSRILSANDDCCRDNLCLMEDTGTAGVSRMNGLR